MWTKPSRFDFAAEPGNMGTDVTFSDFYLNYLLGQTLIGGSRKRGTSRLSPSLPSLSGLLDYRGWPRRRLHSPRAERMKARPPSPPTAQRAQTKKKRPVDLATSP